mmetsp:Transcript_25611/g.54680  ORF Transcript_25611/g.54680 Transcript_25611/m.54680 type:complete len:211 (+) Transcript_25611:2002-2634(+)
MMDDLLEKYLIVATKVFVNVVRPPAILSGGGRKQEIFGGCLHKGDGTARRRGRRVGGKKKGIDDDGLGIGCFVFFQQRSDKHTGPPTDIENATTAARGVCRFQLQPITDEINQILHVFTRFEKVGIIVGFCLCMGFVMGRDRFCCHGSFLLLLLLLVLLSGIISLLVLVPLLWLLQPFQSAATDPNPRGQLLLLCQRSYNASVTTLMSEF